MRANLKSVRGVGHSVRLSPVDVRRTMRRSIQTRFGLYETGDFLSERGRKRSSAVAYSRWVTVCICLYDSSLPPIDHCNTLGTSIVETLDAGKSGNVLSAPITGERHMGYKKFALANLCALFLESYRGNVCR